jgi:hypothetical protein
MGFLPLMQNHFHVDPDSDPVFHVNADPDPLLFKLMGNCDHWSIDPPGLHFEPLGLQCSVNALHGSILSL